MCPKKREEKTAEKKNAHKHPDHSSQISRCRRIKGQLGGIERMIESHMYCPDILIQIRAAGAALKALESNILEGHFHHCVKDAFESRDPSARQEKIDELMDLFRKG